jgi:hypothetical protein
MICWRCGGRGRFDSVEYRRMVAPISLPQNQPSMTDKAPHSPLPLAGNHHIAVHRFIVGATYVAGTTMAWMILRLPEAVSSSIATLSAGAILATFGSAITAVSSLWERDLADRITLEIDILMRDILNQPNPWRRWPFLPRRYQMKLLDGEHITRSELKNPQIPLDVGTHTVHVDIPTVSADFFDLPMFKNWRQLTRFRKGFITAYMTKSDVSSPSSPPYDQLMAYECLHDIWQSILGFRLARYAVHFGAALVIASGLIALLKVLI